MKIAYNGGVYLRAVGAQNAVTPCASFDGSLGGSVHISGMATVNAVQGASIVSLRYEFRNCRFFAPPDPSAEQNFGLTFNGLVNEQGTLSVQPTATTALLLETPPDPSTELPSESLSIAGTVYDPPLDYAVSSCALSMIQNGNELSGALCGRDAGFSY